MKHATKAVIFVPVKRPKDIFNILILGFLLCPVFQAMAQDSTTVRKRVIFMGIGPVSYKGDLGAAYQSASFLFNIGLKFNHTRKLNGNLNVSIGSVTGQELDYVVENGMGVEMPNAFFNTQLIGFNYELHYNLVHKKNYKIYVSQGVGLLRFNPRNENSKDLIDQPGTRPPGETYGNIALMLPTQIGAAYYFANGYGFGIQMGLVNTITDNLDNLSTWGNKKGNDNLFQMRFELHVPIKF